MACLASLYANIVIVIIIHNPKPPYTTMDHLHPYFPSETAIGWALAVNPTSVDVVLSMLRLRRSLANSVPLLWEFFAGRGWCCCWPCC
jgi:hypothetical protein